MENLIKGFGILIETKMDNEPIKILTLENAASIVSEKLCEVNNIRKLCVKHNLCYRNVLDVKHNKQTKYPHIIKTLLFIFYNLEVDFKHILIIKNSD